MREQKPEERIKNFNEVALGYTEEEAVKEAARCLNCKKPLCVSGCPVEIDIPGFITAIKEKNFSEAIRILKEKNSLPGICGRVCPQEDQCEKMCILGKKNKAIDIGALERFAADWEMEQNSELSDRRESRAKSRETQRPEGVPSEAGGRAEEKCGKKVAVIGAGPAGLTCAADLIKMGYEASIFESLHKPGGVLIYGIPNFRLPKTIIDIEVDYIKSLGVNLEVNMVIGKSITIDGLRKKGFSAFFLGTGAGLPYFLGIDGEEYNGVYSANEFLTRINLMKAYLFPEYDTPVTVGKKVAVIGAGNVALDSARCAKRLGAEEVTIVYRRSVTEMPARQAEIEHAKEEGIKFELLVNPIKIFGDTNGWVTSMECLRNTLGEPDASGRRRPVPIDGSNFRIDVDTVVCAIGQGPNPLLLSTIKDLKLTKKKNIDADQDTGITSVEDIFAGGDIVTGAATVIHAMGAGKRAARSIDKYLKSI